MRNLILICLIAFPIIMLLNTKAFAQTTDPQFRIVGTIADSATLDSVPFVTVTLKKGNNETAKVTVTKENGYFEFNGLQPISYQISITSAGYGGKTITVNLSDSTKDAGNLGVILITTQAKTLQTVSVTADRPIVRREADRITYDMQADPDSRSSNALDMMRKVPFLSVDANGNILLKGSGSYRIFINGKPSGMLTTNPKEVLNAMPASTIKRIEVITTPPSKYDAEGLAGIINIILEKRLSDGYNGNINVSGRFPQGGPGLGGSVSIKKGKLGISAYGGGNLNRVPTTSVVNTRNTFTSSPTTLVQDGYIKSNTGTLYFGTDISYEVDSIHLITGSLNVFANKADGNNFQNSTMTGGSQILERYSYDNDFTNKGKGIDAGINYQRGFRSDKNKLLTFSYTYRNSNSDQFNNVLIGNRIKYEDPDYQQFNDARAYEHTAQIDYIQGLKDLFIEAGVKGIFRTNKSDFQHYAKDSTTNDFEMVSGLSNKFRNTQNVYGVYNSYNYNKKNWSVRAGVRVEQTVTDADFISTATKVHQDYLHLIPTVAVSYRLKGNSNVNFGFSRRIKRPGIYKLNPFVDRSNPNFEFTGNPDLMPSLVNNFVLGYGLSRKVNINLGLGYSFFTGLDFRVSEYDPVTNITRTTFKNIGEGTAYSTDLNISYPITKRWNASLNSNFTYIDAEGVNDGTIMAIDNLLYNINVSTSYRFDKNWRLSANLNAIGPGVISLQSESNSMLGTGFTLAKEAAKGRLILSATVNNPFTKYRNNRITTTGSDFFETNVTREYFRNYGFSLTWRFGNLKDGIKKNKRGINNTDLSNSKGGL